MANEREKRRVWKAAIGVGGGMCVLACTAPLLLGALGLGGLAAGLSTSSWESAGVLIALGGVGMLAIGAYRRHGRRGTGDCASASGCGCSGS